jgi:hypothetical protein
VRIGNAAFLLTLLINLVMPAGWLHRSLAGGPEQRPPTGSMPMGRELGPLDGDFIERTWIETHERLFGPAPEGLHTAFYAIDGTFGGVGEYAASNSVGQPLTIEVIRYHDYGAIPAPPPGEGVPIADGQQPTTLGGSYGLAWATLSTEQASVNVIAFYFAAPGQAAAGPGGEPVHGIMPFIDHDVLFDGIALGDVDDPSDDLSFDEMAEGYNGPCSDEDLMECLTCLNGTIWCPCLDPVIRVAIDLRKECVRSAILTYTLTLASVALALRDATIACLAIPSPGVQWSCLAAAHTAATDAMMAATAALAAAIADCYSDFFAIRNAAAAAACAAGSGLGPASER